MNESFRYEFVFGTNVEKAFLKWTFTNLNEHSDPSVHIHNENGAFLWILLDENDPAHHIIAQGTFHWKATGTMVPENPKLEAVIEQSGRGALKIQLISVNYSSLKIFYINNYNENIKFFRNLIYLNNHNHNHYFLFFNHIVGN